MKGPADRFALTAEMIQITNNTEFPIIEESTSARLAELKSLSMQSMQVRNHPIFTTEPLNLTVIPRMYH